MKQKPAWRLFGKYSLSDVAVFFVGFALMALVLVYQAPLISFGHWFFHVLWRL